MASAERPLLAEGPAREWLEARREELNARFLLARRRFPRLDGRVVLDLAAELLPALAGKGERGSAELMQSIYELILLHAGRGLVGADAGETPLGVLLRETFPRLRPLLLKDPRALPAALSNAVENHAEHGIIFARALPDLAAHVTEPAELLDAGAVLAWRLGQPRLREQALDLAAKLPPAATLAALLLEDWPAEAAEPLRAALQADAWRAPEQVLSSATRARLKEMPAGKVKEVRERLAAPPLETAAAWDLGGSIGNFTGFGGTFEEPPLLLDAGARGTRHRFWALSTDGVFRIDADVFGWTCRPDAQADFPVQEVRPKPGKLAALLKGVVASPRLYPDGQLEGPGGSVKLEAAAGAATFVTAPGLVAFTRPDSFRVRVLTALMQPMPADLFFTNEDRKVFPNAGAFIKVFFLVQVVRSGRVANFGRKLGSAMQIKLPFGLPAIFLLQPQMNVGLRRIHEH